MNGKEKSEFRTEAFKSKLEKKLKRPLILPFGPQIWDYRTLVEIKKTRKLNRMLNTMARFIKEKPKLPFNLERFLIECEDSDSSYGRDESVLFEGYYVSSLIYRGSPGIKLYLCEKSVFSNKPKTDKVVVKIVNFKKTFNDYIYGDFKKQLEIILQLKHPFVIETFCVLFSRKQYYIFMRYAEKGDLFAYLINYGGISEKRARIWIAQIANALTFLHSLNIAHCDVCCENILITERNNLKLTDFENAEKIEYEIGKVKPLRNYYGAIEYATPEILMNKPYKGTSADTWALAVVLYAMLTAHLPFTGTNSEELIQSQKNWKMPDSDSYSTQLVILLYKSFEFKSKHRFRLRRFVQSEWFKMDPRLVSGNPIESKKRPKKGVWKSANDPDILKLIEDPAQEKEDYAEVVRVEPFPLHHSLSEEKLYPAVYKGNENVETGTDDESYSMPFDQGKATKKEVKDLQSLCKSRRQSKRNEKPYQSEGTILGKLLHRTYEATRN